MPTISEILEISYPHARGATFNGRVFFNPELEHRHRLNQVVVMPLGVFFHFRGEDFPIQQLSVPMVWSVERDHDLEWQKINLVEFLIKNAWRATDEHLLDLLDNHNLIVSQDFLYRLGETHDNHNLHLYNTVDTAYAAIPLDRFEDEAD